MLVWRDHGVMCGRANYFAGSDAAVEAGVSVFRKAIRSARTGPAVTAMVMVVPGTTVVGAARYFSKVGASQVRPDFFIASEKAKPSSVPALRPTTPRSAGPVVRLSAVEAWQAAHCAVKARRPLAALPSAENALSGRETRMQAERKRVGNDMDSEGKRWTACPQAGERFPERKAVWWSGRDVRE